MRECALPERLGPGRGARSPFGLTSLSTYLALVVLFLPLLAGMFLGVPLLAREHEQRTLLLAWSQDITPQRWVWTKLAILGAITAAASAAASAAVDHLAHVASITTNLDLFSGLAFTVTGMLPMVQSVVWLAIGVALGVAYRRTLPAIFTALVGYIAAFFLVQWAYPSFMTPLAALVPSLADPAAVLGGANALVIQKAQVPSTTRPAAPSARPPCNRCARAEAAGSSTARAWRSTAS